jgi:hypothetical protein
MKILFHFSIILHRAVRINNRDKCDFILCATSNVPFPAGGSVSFTATFPRRRVNISLLAGAVRIDPKREAL